MVSPTVDEVIQKKVQPQHREVVEALRRLMRESAPQVEEVVSYGIPAWRGRRILAVLSPTKKDVTFAFSRGAELNDAYGLLRGVGKVEKHVKLTSVADLNTTALRDYIRQAVALDAN